MLPARQPTPPGRPGEPDPHGVEVTKRAHPEYLLHHETWQFLQDSLEGGARYRDAEYRQYNYVVRWRQEDEQGRGVYYNSRTYAYRVRNLTRHPREYPTPFDAAAGYDGGETTGDNYEFRRQNTPVPTFISQAITQHLGRIYAREVKREAPEGPLGDKLRAWWEDCDGAGSSIDEWMAETVAPLFLVLGFLDLAFDHPPAPEGTPVETQADVLRLDLGRCVASYILPANLPDWTLGDDWRYTRCVVREWADVWDAKGETYQRVARYREWTDAESRLYDADGVLLEVREHPYGSPPIERGFYFSKPTCDNVGQSRYEGACYKCRTRYNQASELVLAVSRTAHAMLSGPVEYVGGNTVDVGPDNVLPVNKDGQGWAYVTPPSEPVDKLLRVLAALDDDITTDLCLAKPAGAAGTTGATVAQSGVSKAFDAQAAGDLLLEHARALERLERLCVRRAVQVLTDGKGDDAFVEAVTVTYPTKFDLFQAADFAALLEARQQIKAGLDGETPKTDGAMLNAFNRLILPGRDDKEYEAFDKETAAMLTRREAEASQPPPPVVPTSQVQADPASEPPMMVPTED